MMILMTATLSYLSWHWAKKVESDEFAFSLTMAAIYLGVCCLALLGNTIFYG